MSRILILPLVDRRFQNARTTKEPYLYSIDILINQLCSMIIEQTRSLKRYEVSRQLLCFVTPAEDKIYIGGAF